MRHSCAAHNVGSSTARVCSRSRETLVCTHARARDSRKARAQFTSTRSVAVDKSGRCSFTMKKSQRVSIHNEVGEKIHAESIVNSSVNRTRLSLKPPLGQYRAPCQRPSPRPEIPPQKQLLR